MSLVLKDSTGNYLLDQVYDNKFPATSLLALRTGSPAGPNNAAGGTKLAEVTSPSSPWGVAASKSKAKANVWSTTGIAAGNAGHYRMTNAGDTEREEGTVTATGSGGDVTLDNINIAISQTVIVNSFTHTAP